MGLKSVKIGKNVTSIGNRCFVNLLYLTDVSLPDSLKKIGKEAFFGTGITSIYIGKNVSSIGDSAFSECEELREVSIEKGKLKSLPYECFSKCSSLQYIILPSNITKLGEKIFSGCVELELVNIKGKVTCIPKRCFSGCISLKQFIIPSTVTTIEDFAFSGTGLEDIKIPNKVKVLGFISRKEMNELYDQADYIITHAGAGSMIQSLKKGKTTIAVPRLSKYGEHVNDHQIELADKLEKLGYLLVYHDGDQIKEVFNRAKQFKVKPYRLKGKLLELVDETIEAYIR
jgi:UDP-N-acetylglucosamine transferase subunit ALG13